MGSRDGMGRREGGMEWIDLFALGVCTVYWSYHSFSLINYDDWTPLQA